MRSTILLWCVAAAAAPVAHDEQAPSAPSASPSHAGSAEQTATVDYSLDSQSLDESDLGDNNRDSNHGQQQHSSNDHAPHDSAATQPAASGSQSGNQNAGSHADTAAHGAGNAAGHAAGHMDNMDASPASMEHHHGRPILQNPHLEPQQRKYWEQYDTTTFFTTESGSKFNLWTHAVLSVVAFALLSPLTLSMSGDRNTQWLYVPLQTAQTVIGCLSILFLWFYAPTAPALYPNNAYAPFSIAMFVLLCAHWLVMIVRAISTYMAQGDASGGRYEYAGSRAAGLDDEDEDEDESPTSFALDDLSDERHESGSSTEFGSDTDQSSFEGQHAPPPMPKPEFQRAPQMSSMVRKLAQNSVFAKLNRAIGGAASALFTVMNIPMFFVGWGYLLTGVATAFLMGKGHYVFALLAHFIKGFVFVVLGFVELSRFFGAGSSRGWAWNELYSTPSPHLRSRSWWSKLRFWPENATIEFWQCFLIFFYGSTNVFLEHLGNTDGVWSHKDLQHASIAFMFFGGGLCGMIIESTTVKRSLAAAFGNSSRERVGGELRRGWSMNPMPAFIIFWTGALMSHHEQETELSTAIHIQWGYLFSLAAVVRLVTLGLLFTRPRVHSHSEAAQPQKPFTEVITAFCLVCGGMIFMGSNRESVEGMIYRGMDQMFTLNVSVGITVILMAYFTGCLAVKGWAASRY